MTSWPHMVPWHGPPLLLLQPLSTSDTSTCERVHFKHGMCNTSLLTLLGKRQFVNTLLALHFHAKDHQGASGRGSERKYNVSKLHCKNSRHVICACQLYALILLCAHCSPFFRIITLTMLFLSYYLSCKEKIYLLMFTLLFPIHISWLTS